MKRQNTTQQKPRLFRLVRHTDVSGVRGTGTLAEGVEWSDGAVTLRWRGRQPATSVWDGGIEALLAVHGRNGRTLVHWLTTPQLTTTEQQPSTQSSAAQQAIQQYADLQLSTPQTAAAHEAAESVGLWLPAPGVDGRCRRCGRGWPCLGCDP